MLNIVRMSATLLVGVAIGVSPVVAQTNGQISDFMVMRVCTATADPNAPALQGVAPGDTACANTRQITDGETPPYTLRDYAAKYIVAAAASCPNSFGPLLRANVPVSINGVTRLVTFSQTGSNATCSTAAQTGSAAQLADTSVQSVDATTGYGFIMGSSSPNGVSLNDAYNLFANGAVTGGIPAQPVCKSATPYSSARFANSWLIGNSPVAASLPGPVQFATVDMQNITPDTFTYDQITGTTCSTPYVGSFHIWRADWYMFYSGRMLPAVVAAHYTQASANNAGPGPAQQMERTYWTREFGLSRWEKWTRSDLLLSGQDPKSVSKALLSHATCAQVGRAAGSPYPIVTNATDSHTTGSMVLSNVNGVYEKVVGPDGVVWIWYMTLCADYTNIDRSTTGQNLPIVPSNYDVLWGP